MPAAVETIAFAGATPWHGLGTPADDAVENWVEFCELAGLSGWDVRAEEFQPMVNLDGSSVLLKSPTQRVIIRGSDKSILGFTDGARWQPYQNEQAFQWFDQFVQSGLAKFHTAGSLHGGKLVWVLAQINGVTEIQPGDDVGRFLLMSMSHTGRKGISILPTTVRVVCANTEAMAVAQGKELKSILRIAHSSQTEHQMGDLAVSLQPVLHSWNDTMDRFQMLARRQTTDNLIEQYLTGMWPQGEKPTARKRAAVKKITDEILEIYESGGIGGEDFAQERKHNLFMLHEATVQWVDHSRGQTSDTRLEAAWFGDGAKLKQKSLQVAELLS